MEQRPAYPVVTRLVAVAVLVGLAAGTYLGLATGSPTVLFAAKFPRSGLVTNEYAYYNPGDRQAISSSDWEATSGSLFARDGAGWTGVPDGTAPDARSSWSTDSAVFRLRTPRGNFGNVAVSFRLRLDRLLTTARTPAQAYDGVHVWLHYQNPNWLYFASVSRRDGRIVIGKKLPTAGGGQYADLDRVPNHFFPLHRWESVEATIAGDGHKVIIRVLINGRLVARTVDDGTRGPTILRPGHLGIRGDNAEFEFKDFKAAAV
jgi:hypothetical protein